MTPPRVKTLTFDDTSDHGFTLDDLQAVVAAMREDGIPGNAIPRIETIGQRGELRVGSITASDRADDPVRRES